MKRFLSIVLSVVMVMSTMSFGVLAATSSDVSSQASADTWDGTADTSWYTGDESTYTIYSAEDLAGLAQLVNNGTDFSGETVKLGANIDLEAYSDSNERLSFRPIGDSSSFDNATFNGTFDGGSHTISNLYQSGWAFGYEWGSYGSLGLFGEIKDATVKNLTIKDAEILCEGGDVAAITGSATGTCVFENITVSTSNIATYNNGCASIIAWSGDGNYTFHNITIDDDVVLTGLWGSFDSSVGGVVGQAEPGATYEFNNIYIACQMNIFNDCTASYDYYNYRMCGMLIGRMEKTTTIGGKKYPDMNKYNIKMTNVKVTIGEWANYTYCDPTPGYNGGRGMRVEAGYSYDGLPADYDHSQCTTHCKATIAFDTIFGGPQLAVEGIDADDFTLLNINGIEVTDRALEKRSAARLWGLSTTQRTDYVPLGYFESFDDALIAASDASSDYSEVKIELLNDVEWETGAGHGSTPLVEENSNAVLTIDGNGYTFKATGAGVGPIRAANGTLLTFNNVKFVDESESYAENSWEFGYLEFAGKLRFVGCDFTGAISIDGDEAEFINCTFKSTKDSEYAVWLSNGSNSFENCTFSGARGLKMHEAYGSEISSVSVEKCIFEDITKKPGIAIGTVNADTLVKISDCQVINAQAGDQNAYLLESDTEVSTFAYEAKNNEIKVDDELVTPGVKIGDREYPTFESALAVASDGETIDLRGNSFVFDSTLDANKDITIKNGTLDATGVEFASGFGVFVDADEKIKFEDVNFILDNAKAKQGFFYVSGEIEFVGGSVKADGTIAAAIFHGGEIDPEGTFVINGTTIELKGLNNADGCGRGFLYSTLDVDDGTITMKGLKDNGMRSVRGTVDNSTIFVDGVEYGLKNDVDSDILTLTNTTLTVKNAANKTENAGIYLSKRGLLVQNDNTVVNSDIYIPATEENITKKVKLSYEPTDKQNVYNIYVESDDEGVINRLSAIQLKFKLESDTNMSYTLAPVKGVSLTNAIDEAGVDTSVEDVYVFNFTGENGVADKTGAKIQIGTVTFGGYGKFNFKVVASEGNYTAKAKTAEAADNIVAEYVPAPATEKQGLFDLDASALTGAEVVEVRRDVVVNIAFNNNLKDSAANIADYNQMKVTLTGSNGKTYESEVCFDGANVTSYTNEQATLTFSVEANTRYTVTVSGAGYRTVRYTTLVDEADEALELNFWNNALENADRTARTEEIEAGVARSAKSVTFLAGDISPDNTIDKYDLAAVVSYFGYDNLKSDAKYYGFAKYDLNRDGQIDADDIATVLISWGK